MDRKTDESQSGTRRGLARLERLVPPELRGEHDQLRRALLLVALSLAGAALGLILAPVTLATVEPELVVAAILQPIISAFLYIAAIGLLWRTKAIAPGGHWLVGWIYLQTCFSLTTLGGLGGPIWSSFTVVPLLAAVMIGRFAGLLWGALTILAILAFFVADRVGVVFPAMIERAEWPPLIAAISTLSIVFLLVIVLMSEATKDEAILRAREFAQRAREAAVEEERARIRATQAIAANEAKSAFLATMSHELRTPLNIVIGYGEILEEEIEARGHADLHEPVERVNGAARHLLALISDILDLSRIEADKVDLVRERIPLRPFVLELCESFEPLARERGNALRTDIDDTLPPLVSDRLRLRQILVNLVANAIKFTADGSITLRVRRGVHDGRPAVAFSVIDTGIGIPDEKLQVIFLPFTQADASTTRLFGGAGLGLALSERLARLLGGAITVESRVGEGSTFTLLVPLAEDTAEPQ